MVVAFFRLPNGAVHSLEVHAGQVVEVKNIPAMDLLTPSVEQLSNMTKPQLENMTSEYGIDIPKKSTKLQIIEALRNDWQSRVMPTLRLRPTLLEMLGGGCNSDDDDTSESEAELPSGSGAKIIEEDEVEVIPIDEPWKWQFENLGASPPQEDGEDILLLPRASFDIGRLAGVLECIK